MNTKQGSAAERAQTASRDEIPDLIRGHDAKALTALLENPQLEVQHLLLLLKHNDLPVEMLDSIARRKEWLRDYRVRRALVFHPRMPRLTAMRLARELYLMDLVQLSVQPASPLELRRFAEEIILARMKQIPLGQKLMLARRATARVAGSLLAEGKLDVATAALDNASLTEAQVLKVLAREELPSRAVAEIAAHRKWSQVYNVRLALLRHPKTALERVLAFLPELSQRDLEGVAGSRTLPPKFRECLRGEIARRRSSARGTRKPEITSQT